MNVQVRHGLQCVLELLQRALTIRDSTHVRARLRGEAERDAEEDERLPTKDQDRDG